MNHTHDKLLHRPTAPSFSWRAPDLVYAVSAALAPYLLAAVLLLAFVPGGRN